MTDKPGTTIIDLIGRVLTFAGILLLVYGLYETHQAPSSEPLHGGAEKLSDPIHYGECHKHDTYGAFIGCQLYCMVPVERMGEMK